MNSPSRSLATALAAALLLLTPTSARAEENTPAFDPEKLDAPGQLHENDIQLAEFEMLAIPYDELAARAEATSGDAAKAARWQAYASLLRNPAAKHEAGFAGDTPLATQRDGRQITACPEGDLPCLSAFWSERPEIEKWIGPTVANGALVLGAGNAVATEVFALAAGTLTVPGLVVTGIAVGSFVVVWKVTEGMSPEEEATRYGNDIDKLLGRTWIQRNLNSYRYTFEGILRMAWSLRDANDGVVRQQARRILLLEGASHTSQNCAVSLSSMWDTSEACNSTTVARHMAFRSWLAILGYLNESKQWGLNIKGTVEDGKLFRRYFPSLGSNEHPGGPTQGAPSMYGLTMQG